MICLMTCHRYHYRYHMVSSGWILPPWLLPRMKGMKAITRWHDTFFRHGKGN